MANNRWLLPNGIHDLLAEDAQHLELLRRKILDSFSNWGYQLVQPPLVEFTDSLLTGLGKNLDRYTYKFSDNQSGKTLGIRADISPQTARIDAHSMQKQGANRLCYVGTLLRAMESNALQNRAPEQIGAELFGIDSIEADYEIVAIMLNTVKLSEASSISLTISHQAVKQWLKKVAKEHDLDTTKCQKYIANKLLPELQTYIEQQNLPPSVSSKLLQMPRVIGGHDVLEQAKKRYADEPLLQQAFDDMQQLAQLLQQQYVDVELCFNLSGMLASDYHTGLLFAAFTQVNGVPKQVANGGRYNEVGAAFGRARAATGFSADLKDLVAISTNKAQRIKTVLANSTLKDQANSFWQECDRLRLEGYRVVLGYPQDNQTEQQQDCDFALTWDKSSWSLHPLK